MLETTKNTDANSQFQIESKGHSVNQRVPGTMGKVHTFNVLVEQK